MSQDRRNGNEQEILKKLLVDEKDILQDLSALIDQTVKVFRIDKTTGKILFQNFASLSDPKRILGLLSGKYFAQRLGLVNENSLGITEIGTELGRPATALSGPVKDLVKKGLIDKLPNKKYRVAYNRLGEVINSLTKKREAKK